MYAVIQTGGKQYRVQAGDIVQIEKLEGDVGSEVKFGEVLMTSKPAGDSSQIQLGKPLLSGASVTGEIVGQGRGEKVIIVKMKRRKQYRRTQGHRQFQTQVLVTGISAGSDSAKLSAEDKKAKLDKFHSYLTPKGEAFSRPVRGVWTMGLASAEAQATKAPAKKAAAPKKAAAATGETPKKTAAKKAPAKKKAE